MKYFLIVCVLFLIYSFIGEFRTTMHDVDMHEEHDMLHNENKMIYDKVEENGKKLDFIINYITNSCVNADLKN